MVTIEEEATMSYLEVIILNCIYAHTLSHHVTSKSTYKRERVEGEKGERKGETGREGRM